MSNTKHSAVSVYVIYWLIFFCVQLT